MQQQLVGQPNGGASIGANDQFGTSCVIDGTSVAVAAPGVDYGAVAINIGAAFVFTSNGTTWSLQRAVTGSVSPSGLSVVALSGDLLVLSSPTESSRGAAYLFRRNGTTWTAQAPRLTSNDNLGRGFGSGISTDGVSLFVGAPNAVPSTGAPGSAASVYVVGTAPTGVPGAPSAFTAAASGNVVSMSWGAPTSGGAPTSYTLIARVGGVVVLQLPLGNVTTYTASAPNGTYSLAMLVAPDLGTSVEWKDAIREVIAHGEARYGRVFCPHTACAVRVLERIRERGDSRDWAVVATAHPAKFEQVVEPLVGHAVEVPAALAMLLDRPSQAEPIGADFEPFRERLRLI